MRRYAYLAARRKTQRRYRQEVTSRARTRADVVQQVRTYRRDTLRLHQLITAVRHVIMRTVQKVATILQTVHSQVTISIMTKRQQMRMERVVQRNGHIKQAVVRIQQIQAHTAYLR